MRQVGTVWIVFTALVLAAVGGSWAWLGVGEQFGGFVYGLGLFAGNFALLTLLGQRLFGAVDGSEEPAQRGGVGVVILFAMKMAFLGLGAYVGLALLRLLVLWFVVGVVAGLVLVTVASASPFRRASGEP